VAEARVPGKPRRIAPGVWLVTGGVPLPVMNVYLIEDSGGGVTMFDAGVRSMVSSLRKACDELGGLNRIVLGHGHADHRGAAPGLGAPVYCHPDNVPDTEGDAGRSYIDRTGMPPPGRYALPLLMKHVWDGGPVRVSGTVTEGEDVAGFKVVDISGHAPGQIALLRESDGVALTSDCFYTLDPQTGIGGKPRLPPAMFNLDEQGTRDAVRKMAEIDPSVAWPGHAKPLRGNVRDQLLKVAATPLPRERA
jgi:hydroxyacylglutathione hydrolase